jgi:hypothetical protein
MAMPNQSIASAENKLQIAATSETTSRLEQHAPAKRLIILVAALITKLRA